MADLFAQHPVPMWTLSASVLLIVVILVIQGLAYLFDGGGRQRDDHEGGVRLPKAPR